MRILEIFYSIQGEGKDQGKPAIFIRFAGCNLDCKWCDTPGSHDPGKQMDLTGILEEAGKFPCKNICITGGEPLLQLPGLLDLLGELCSRGYSVGIETNGTINFTQCQPFAGICMDVKCPSSGEESDLSLLEKIAIRDSVKFVVADRGDCNYAADLVRSREIQGEIFFSPVCGSDYGEIAAFILDRGLPVRLQVQLHKILGVK
jgi:7-carboxy-7-deazaguanine synthase